MSFEKEKEVKKVLEGKLEELEEILLKKKEEREMMSMNCLLNFKRLIGKIPNGRVLQFKKENRTKKGSRTLSMVKRAPHEIGIIDTGHDHKEFNRGKIREYRTVEEILACIAFPGIENIVKFMNRADVKMTLLPISDGNLLF